MKYLPLFAQNDNVIGGKLDGDWRGPPSLTRQLLFFQMSIATWNQLPITDFVLELRMYGIIAT